MTKQAAIKQAKTGAITLAYKGSDNDTNLLRRRFEELCDKADRQQRWVYSDFLSPADQSVLLEMGYAVQPYELYGGWDAAERKLICFGSEELCYCPAEPPVVCISIQPKMAKFSGRMGHRDILGSIMGLGIKRETVGDILIRDGGAWVFCLESISGYILSQLESVGRTAVKCALSQPPEFTQTVPEAESIPAASDRVDALCAAVYDLSRTDSKEAINAGLVFVDSRMVTDPSNKVKPGSLVNLRGKGRFLYNGPVGETRSGRLRASVSIYK